MAKNVLQTGLFKIVCLSHDDFHTNQQHFTALAHRLAKSPKVLEITHSKTMAIHFVALCAFFSLFGLAVT